ncbi:hypothetical protein POVWA2_052390 [Plasmodium ovale wallikeri]|uniref:Uncharacterized protein n=1 Tax=Plasmodium ovale wallikeri TaxID=864142 RepID=A0A1A8ZQE7_PLAOA|nr:hypothetical protein POVWA1_053120 [Plasmodium ovale wallikeri]SBT46629.1 hypothetical protein POVWA2_052390 [Plasmodium ovale wallikeri]
MFQLLLPRGKHLQYAPLTVGFICKNGMVFFSSSSGKGGINASTNFCIERAGEAEKIEIIKEARKSEAKKGRKREKRKNA